MAATELRPTSISRPLEQALARLAGRWWAATRAPGEGVRARAADLRVGRHLVLAAGEPCKAERREQQTEVPQRDVVEVSLEQEVDDDPTEPGGNEVAPEAWLERDGQAGDDLDHTDDQHRLVRVAGHDAVDLATVAAPDLVPTDAATLHRKEELTASIARGFADAPVEQWIERLESAGVPCGAVHERETTYADPQVVAERLVGKVAQPGLGDIRLLAPFVRVGGETPAPAAAPALGADTDAVLAELA